MSRKANPTIVGAFVVGGLALLVVGVVLLASGRWFRDTHRAVVYFRQSVDGLRVGAAVTFRGIQVGTVRDIRLNLSQLRQRPDHIRIPVVIELDQGRLSSEGASSTSTIRGPWPRWSRKACARSSAPPACSPGCATSPWT